MEEESMNKSKDKLLRVGILSAGVLLLFGCATLQSKATKSSTLPQRILFVGNCLSYSNMGLDYDLRELAATANPPLLITADRSTRGGVALEGLWLDKAKSVHKSILEGKYDIVVVQGTLAGATEKFGDHPADTEEKLHEYAGRFDKEIRKGGGRTVLFMNWQFGEPETRTIDDIARVYGEVAAERSVEVAPVGVAWQRAQAEQSNLKLLSDTVHPNVQGSDLSACVVYATLFKRSPVGLTYKGGVLADEAAFLQRIAWETVQEYSQPSRTK
jgi:hypothetical protein